MCPLAPQVTCTLEEWQKKPINLCRSWSMQKKGFRAALPRWTWTGAFQTWSQMLCFAMDRLNEDAKVQSRFVIMSHASLIQTKYFCTSSWGGGCLYPPSCYALLICTLVMTVSYLARCSLFVLCHSCKPDLFYIINKGGCHWWRNVSWWRKAQIEPENINLSSQI